MLRKSLLIILYALLVPLFALTVWWFFRDQIVPSERITIRYASDIAHYGWLSWSGEQERLNGTQVLSYLTPETKGDIAQHVKIQITPTTSKNTAALDRQVWLLSSWAKDTESVKWGDLPATSTWQQKIPEGYSTTPAMLFSGGDPEPFSYTLTTAESEASLVFIQHPWSGGVQITINDGPLTYIDLYSPTGTTKQYYLPIPHNIANIHDLKTTVALHGIQTIRWNLSEVQSKVKIESIEMSGLRSWKWKAGDPLPRVGVGATIKEEGADGLLVSVDNASTGWLEWSNLPALPNYPASQQEQWFIGGICLALWSTMGLVWLALSLWNLRVKRPWLGGALVGLPVAIALLLVGSVAAQAFRSKPTIIADEQAQFVVESVVEGLQYPVGVAFAADNRMFVIEKGGFAGAETAHVKLIRPNQTTAETILSLPVCTNAERGLLGIALDPAFDLNGFVYLYYTRQLDECKAPSTGKPPVSNRVSRFTLTANQIDPASEVVLVDNILGVTGSHNSGGIRFAKDGTLYIAIGESIPGSTAQDLTLLGGKILRIRPDPTNLIPADNPFASDANPVTRMVWAYGLRNPYRFGISNSGVVLIGDVGSAPPAGREEINLGAPGANYGWPDAEGMASKPNVQQTLPIYEYEHDNACNSVIGGSFVESAFGNNYRGDYIFGDFSCGAVWAMHVDDTGKMTRIAKIAGVKGHHPTHFETGIDGFIYYADIGGGIWRIRPRV